ncbi:hypothetical protein Chor_003602, partial [Crotalus horridus]
ERLQRWQQCYPNDLSCPICLQTANFPVETNCGHFFCGKLIGLHFLINFILQDYSYCLIEYWKHGSWLRAINCPLCRQEVVFLYTCSENRPDKKSKRTFYDIRTYNKRFSGYPQPVSGNISHIKKISPIKLVYIDKIP